MAPADATIALPGDLVDELCRLIGTLEDWLAHTDPQVLEDLAGFTGQNPDGFIDALGGTVLTLRRWDRT